MLSLTKAQFIEIYHTRVSIRKHKNVILIFIHMLNLKTTHVNGSTLADADPGIKLVITSEKKIKQSEGLKKKNPFSFRLPFA